MKCKTVRLLKITLILFFITLLPIASFYSRYEILTNRLEKDLGFSGNAANAVKHAYAAAEIYCVLRTALNDQQAYSLVMSLGIMNEYIERVTKLRNPDSMREVMKDLHNNQAGILAAKWREQKSNESNLLDIILGMAQNQVLIVARNENPFYKDGDRNDSTVVGTARDWLEFHNDAINERIESKLN